MQDFSYFEKMFKPYLEMPAVGPFRQYQEKWRRTMENWLKMMQSAHAFAAEMPEFSKHVALEGPQFFMQSLGEKTPVTLMQGMNKYLQFLDECWLKVMTTESYSKKSAELMKHSLAFQKALQAMGDNLKHNAPFATQEQVESLSLTIDELRKKVSELQAQLERHDGEGEKAEPAEFQKTPPDSADHGEPQSE